MIEDYKKIILDYVEDNPEISDRKMAEDLQNNPVPYSVIHIRRYISTLKKTVKSLHPLLTFHKQNEKSTEKRYFYTGTPHNGNVLRSHMEKVIKEQGSYDVLIESDAHGWFADLKAQRVINKILKDNHFDEVNMNGDMIDLPFLSRHGQKLYVEGILKGYTEIAEIEYVRDQILKPKALSTNAKLRLRLGNHCERITKPNLLNTSQLAKLAIVYKHFETTKFEEMLSLSEIGIDYDNADIFSYFDIFDVTHGLSFAKNAQEKNLNDYQSSGSTGHSHRLGTKYMTKRKGTIAWFESGCTRLTEQVEYFPTGIVPDWAQGFVHIRFYIDNGKVKYSGQCYHINEGRCVFNGKLYKS
jgi:hypothetical protein